MVSIIILIIPAIDETRFDIVQRREHVINMIYFPIYFDARMMPTTLTTFNIFIVIALDHRLPPILIRTSSFAML
jgi:hypothetical protein